MHTGRTLALLGAIGLIIGALLPWATMTSLFLGITLRASGFEGNGLYSGVIGVVILLVAILYKGQPGKVYTWPVAVLSIIAGIIVGITAIRVAAFQSDSSEITTSLGSGLCVSPLGALLAMIGGFLKVPGQQLEPPQISADVPSQEM